MAKREKEREGGREREEVAGGGSRRRLRVSSTVEVVLRIVGGNLDQAALSPACVYVPSEGAPALEAHVDRPSESLLWIHTVSMLLWSCVCV